MKRFTVGQVDPRITTAVTATMAHLGRNTRGLTPEMVVEMLNNKQYVVRERELYYRKDISGTTSVVEFKTRNQAIVEGITNLDKGTTPSSSFNLVIAAKVGIAKSTAAFDTTPLLANGLYSNYVFDAGDLSVDDTDTDSGATGNQFGTFATQRIQTLFMNGDLEINLNGSELETISGQKLFKPAVYGQSISGEEDFYELAQPRFVAGGQTLDFNFHRRGNTVAVSNYTAMEVRLLALSIEAGAGVQTM